MPYGQSAPTINPNTFPYQRKWTKAETDELEERITKLRNVMVDMVGLSGVVMYIDAGSIANIAAHLALAGVPAPDEDLAYIWRDAAKDDDNMFELVRWHVKRDIAPPPRRPAEPEPEMDEATVKEQARIAREQVDRQLPGPVRTELIRSLIKEFNVDTTEPEEHQ